MPRQLFKRYLPNPKEIKNNKYLKIFGTLIHDPDLWHLNRNSVAKAFAVGLFCAWIPTPFQMVIAAGGAIMFSANLPISVALVWITNPLTMPPMFYVAYKLGAVILGVGELPFHMELSFEWLLHEMLQIWKPFLVGCLAMGVTFSLAGYFGIQMFWRWHVLRRWKCRKDARAKLSK
ncbi:MAG: hypothetical protein AUK35_07690 [Zetaproteobacteria bacterium CG2_30_46_52]|nr:MAG: hypothetical protein AUK35_07690 [Zetaproteobacteria bacterium CG2_30_46_52]